MSHRMARRAQEGVALRDQSERLEPYHRLVELQKEIIEVVRQKAETERQCTLLRERLARESERFLQSRRSRWFRLRLAIVEFLQRRFRNRRAKNKTPHPGASSVAAPGGKAWDCLLSSPQPTQD